MAGSSCALLAEETTLEARRRKRKASLTAGDDQYAWEKPIKDQPERVSKLTSRRSGKARMEEVEL